VQVEFGDQYDTFGCSVGVTATSDLGEGFITNSHCSWAFGDGSDYTPYYQNVYGQGNFVGYEYADPPLLAAGTAGCPSPPASVGCRISDANFVLAPDHVQVGLIARTTGIGSTTIDNNHPWFLIDSDDLVYLMVGDSVQRIGRSTGWKHGEVTYSCVDVLNWTQAGLVLQCQFLSTAVANLGDSGGPAFVWDGSGSYVQIAGLTVGALIDPNTHWIVGSIFSLWMLGTLDLGGVINDLSVAY
jgi:hypothetical protein